MNALKITSALELAADGDKSAFTYIYNETCQELYSFAFGLCHNHDVTEDLMQETYIDAFIKLGELYNAESLMRWLKGILINEWREYVRREKRLPTMSFDGVQEAKHNLISEFSELQDYVEKNETDDEIWKAVNSLPEKQRICILLFHYNNMSVDDISEILDIPQGSVKSRLHYGRERLGKILHKHNIQFNSTAPAAFGGSQQLLAQILQALETASTSAAPKIIAGSSLGAILLKIGAAVLSGAAAVGGIAWAVNHYEPSLQSAGMSSVTAAAPSVTSAPTAHTLTTVSTTSSSSESVQDDTTATQAATVTFDVKDVSGGVAVTRYTGSSTAVTIPKTIDGKTVVAIADGAFENNSTLRSVSIPGTVKTIESNAFRGCRELSSLSIARGVTSIGEAAFLGCTSLKTAVIPASVKTVGFYAFAYSTSLKEVKINEGTQVINYRAFFGCSKLNRVTLPSTISVIGDSAFANTSPDILLRVTDGSYAYEYAAAYGFSYELI